MRYDKLASCCHLVETWRDFWHPIPAPDNWPNSPIPQCTCPISHNAPFRTEMCTFLFWMVNCGIWNRCIVGSMRLVNSLPQVSCKSDHWPISQTTFPPSFKYNRNFISLSSNYQFIAAKFYTCHDRCAPMAYEKMCSNPNTCTRNDI